MKIIGIVGSRRKKGNTYSAVNEVLKSAELEGAKTQLIFLGDYEIRQCTGCEGCKNSFKCVIKDDFNNIFSLMKEADGIVLGSPTYWYNVSADMKLFIDRCYSLIIFEEKERSLWVSAFEDLGKCGIPIAICEQEDESMMGYTYETLKKVMLDLDIRISDGLKGLGYFEAGKVNQDKQFIEKAKIAGRKLVMAIDLKKNVKEKELG